MRNDIDVVITWVDGNEPDWIKEYTYYKAVSRVVSEI